HGVIDGVDETEASVTEANTETSDFFGVGSTFTLTTAIGENVVGTELDDTFNVIGDGADQTLNTFDVINGAGGNDTLNLLLSTAAGGLPTAAQMSNVENIHVDATTAAITALDASALLDVTSLDVGGFGATAITLGEGQSVTLSNTTAATTTLTVDAEEVATTIHLDGAAAATAVTLVGAANTTLDVEGSAGATLTVNAAATTETVDIGLSSDTIVTLTGGAVTTIDASASTGDLGLTATATTETVLGGSGDDALTGGAASQLIDGGAGIDTIIAGNVAGEVIIGGAGADAIDLGVAGAAQEVVINAGDTGLALGEIDTIANFGGTEDTLNFGISGTADNFDVDASAGGYLDALVNANTAFGLDADLTYMAVSDGTDTWVFADLDNNGSADHAVELTAVTGLTAADFGIFA
ncbi:hypothetical protein ACX3P0_12135, partial [Mesorhizobium sp. A556]